MTKRLFRSGLGFRPFFLIAAAFSATAMGLWALLLNGAVSVEPYGGWRFWHAHEMLFGYGGAVIAGFLLTAVRAWTGLNTARGVGLLPLIVIWLLARVLMLFTESEALWVIGLDLLFWICLTAILARPIIQKCQLRNLFAVVAPLLLMIASGLSHVGYLIENLAWQNAGIHGGLFIIVVLMSLIGARVIPLFTRNTTGLSPMETPQWLSRLIAALLWLIALFHLIPDLIPSYSVPTGLGMLLSGILMLIRMKDWHFLATLNTPMLWSLHISYAFIPAGLILLGLYHIGLIAQSDSGIHAITVGAIGGLTLSMMARVSQGHTGRRIHSDSYLVIMFVLIFTAALTRVFTGALSINSLIGWSFSASLWSLAFFLFLFRFVRVLLSPRIDGNPG